MIAASHLGAIRFRLVVPCGLWLPELRHVEATWLAHLGRTLLRQIVALGFQVVCSGVSAAQGLHDEAPKDHFTLGWLMSRMHKRSFGLIMLLLAVVAIAPGVSIVAGLLLVIPALQMVAGQNMPVFPRRIAARSVPTRHLAALVQRAVPVLRYLEKLIHPRWPTPLDATKRLVGAVVAILGIAMVITPVPFTNVVPALLIVLISLAYLEEDGLLLSIALLAGVIVLAIELVAVWEAIRGAKWIVGLWQ